MKSFLTLKSVEEVLALVRTFSPLGSESVALEDAAGRWLSEDWHAPEDLPGFDRSTVDGWPCMPATCSARRKGPRPFWNALAT